MRKKKYPYFFSNIRQKKVRRIEISKYVSENRNTWLFVFWSRHKVVLNDIYSEEQYCSPLKRLSDMPKANTAEKVSLHIRLLAFKYRQYWS